MSHGPKSAQRRARASRIIKHFAQRHGVPGRDGLIDLVASGLVTASLNSGVPGLNGPAQTTHRKLQARGLPKKQSHAIVVAAVERAVIAFAKEGIPLI
jgi:hypothetical protein